MKAIINLFLIVLAFGFSSCAEKSAGSFEMFFSEGLENEVDLSLDGVWQNDDIELTFKGSSATFTRITSGDWLIAKQKGLVSIGAEKINAIKKDGELKWTCYVLGIDYSNSEVSRVGWKNSGKISMSSDGMTISVAYYGSGYQETITDVYTKNTSKSLPKVSTPILNNVASTTASFSTTLTEGGKPITAKGICWSTTENPTVNGNKTSDGTGKETFTSTISSLVANTTYYVKAYATNENGTAYSQQLTLITLPVVNNGVSSKVSYNTATISGIIPAQGSNAITAYGHCWNTTSTPTIDNYKIVSTDLAAGNFSSVLSGLQSNTKYYVRAFITNSKGTSYGNEITFTTTTAILPTVTIGTIGSLTYNSATAEGRITVQGDLPIIEYGHCWSTTSTPTISNNKLASTNLTSGSFSTTLAGLSQSTKYYVRSFATTSSGTYYSSETTFITPADPYTVSDGLLAFYNFNSQNANDALGTYNGSSVGGISYSTTSPSSSGYAAQFDGTSGYLNIQNQVLPVSGSWTYSLWIKSNTNTSGLLMTSGGNYLYIDNTSKLTLRFFYYYTSVNDLTNTLLNNNWHHLVICKVGLNIKYYIDGTLKESMSSITEANFNDHNNCAIGKAIGGTYGDNYFFKGLMDNVRFYNRELTNVEINKLYSTKQ